METPVHRAPNAKAESSPVLATSNPSKSILTVVIVPGQGYHWGTSQTTSVDVTADEGTVPCFFLSEYDNSHVNFGDPEGKLPEKVSEMEPIISAEVGEREVQK